MKAVVRKAYGGVDELETRDIERPEPGPDELLIKVMAFGINRAEIYMRQGLWGDVAAVSGIECVGTVEQDPQGDLQPGQTVAAIMGGMGRTINGSYAEYTCVPRNNVVALNSKLDWAELAAIPESYATAWACLNDNLDLDHCQSLVVRGGTSALGQAAINIAAAKGIEVIASTRNQKRADFLKSIGAAHAVMDVPDLSDQVRQIHPAGVDAVLDIVGNTTLLDSLRMARKGGSVCIAGFLGGGDPVPLNPLTDMPSGVNLNFFASFMFGTPGFSLTDIPLQAIVDNVADKTYKCRPARVFEFADIKQAHELMESNEACGKLVVVV
jgi:NADPH:quinone reductase-like Zn-dependent oxidoreductase